MTNWAIVVGINNYKNLTNLKYAKRDAEVMATWLKSKARFEKVFLFTDDTTFYENTEIPTEPTYADLRGFLGRQFEEPKLEQSDNLWFFFSGHGVRRGDGDYLMLSDSNARDVLFTALSVNYVTERLRRCGAGNVVMFFDACRNEGNDGKDGLGFGTEKIQGIITYYSCQAQEKSWEIYDLQHGAFTYALWEAFHDLGDKGYITVQDLEQYLSSRVPKINKKFGMEIQNPHARIEPISVRKTILFETVSSETVPSDIKNKPNLSVGLSSIKILHIQQKLNELRKKYDYLNEKINYLINSQDLEDLNPEQKFKLSKQIQKAQEEREEIILKIEELDSQLNE